jgi:hypothetical protein
MLFGGLFCYYGALLRSNKAHSAFDTRIVRACYPLFIENGKVWVQVKKPVQIFARSWKTVDRPSKLCTLRRMYVIELESRWDELQHFPTKKKACGSNFSAFSTNKWYVRVWCIDKWRIHCQHIIIA